MTLLNGSCDTRVKEAETRARQLITADPDTLIVATKALQSTAGLLMSMVQIRPELKALLNSTIATGLPIKFMVRRVKRQNVASASVLKPSCANYRHQARKASSIRGRVHTVTKAAAELRDNKDKSLIMSLIKNLHRHPTRLRKRCKLFSHLRRPSTSFGVPSYRAILGKRRAQVPLRAFAHCSK